MTLGVLWQVEAQLRDQVFRDEVEWDMDDPQNTAFSYANAVCCDLGLGWVFAAAITGAVEAQLTAKRQVCGDSLLTGLLTYFNLRACGGIAVQVGW